MLNETINGTQEIVKNLTYGEITSLTHQISFVFAGIIVWFLPLFIYILIALNSRPRSRSNVYDGNMLSTINGWIPLIIFGFLTGGLLLLGFYFPIWANF